MRKLSGSVRSGARRGATAPPIVKRAGNKGSVRAAAARRMALRSVDRQPRDNGEAVGRAENVVRARTAVAEATVGSRGKYVYCIVRATEPLRFGPIGIGAIASDVYTVHYKNLAAVVSDAPLEALDSTREHVLAHERVNETVMRDHTVIPMSFGTIFKTREDIVELLRSAAEAFGDVLNKMQNKLGFGLKV